MDVEANQGGVLYSIAHAIGAPEQALRLLISILLGSSRVLCNLLIIIKPPASRLPYCFIELLLPAAQISKLTACFLYDHWTTYWLFQFW